MSRRRGVVARVDLDTDGGVSPNAYVPLVTCEVRVFWPPRATEAQIMDAIHDAADQAIEQVLANGDFVATIAGDVRPAGVTVVPPLRGLGVDDSAPVTQAGDQIV